MSYATLDDMVTRFGAEKLTQLSRPDGGAESDPNAPDPVVIQAALDDATEMVNAYAAGRYTVPLNPVPAPVRRWCADMTLYYLYLSQNGPPEDVRKSFEDALKGLSDMQKGVVIFQAGGVPSPEKPAGGSVGIAGPHRVFTVNTLQGF